MIIKFYFKTGPAKFGVSKEIGVLNETVDTLENQKTVGKSSITKIREHLKNTEVGHMKVISENKSVHEDLQEALIDKRKLLEEKKELLRQLSSKSQKDVDTVAALEREIEDLKRRNKELTTENTNLKTMLKDHEKKNEEQDEKIKELEKKDKEKSKDIEEQKSDIAKLKKRMERMDALEDSKVNSALPYANRTGGYSGNGLVDVESPSTDIVKSVPHK